MSEMRRYFAKIGRRGGIRSRRTLDPETARRMVRIRENRRAVAHAHASAARRLGGTPFDTSKASQSVQDTLWLRLTPAEKLAHVAGLSCMVDALSIHGLKLRHPDLGADEIHYLRAKLRLGAELAGRVYRTSRDVA